MKDRRTTGQAVADAKRLNECYHGLSEAIASLLELPGDRERWHYDYAALPSDLEGAAREEWNHKAGSKNIAEDALRGAIESNNLQLWTVGPFGEAKVDRYELKELTFRTFASGTYQPNNLRLDNAALAGSPLWVKDADWHRYMNDLWTTRYGINWTDPAPLGNERAPVVKTGRPPSDEQILRKADEMKARGMDGRTLASQMRLEPGFENVATTYVRELIKGRWKPGGRPKKHAY